MKKLLMCCLVAMSLFGMAGCSKELTEEDISKIEQTVANKVFEEMQENITEWSNKEIDSERYKYRLEYYRDYLLKAKDIKVAITKMEDENYEMMIGFYYEPIYNIKKERLTIYTFTIDKDVNIRDLVNVEIKDLNSVEGITIVEESSYFGDEAYNVHIREGYNNHTDCEEEDLSVHSIESEKGLLGADDFFTKMFNQSLGNLEVIDF